MKYIASKKLAIILIIVLTVIAVTGMIVPQEKPGNTGYGVWKNSHTMIAPTIELLHLNKIFTSWWVKILFALFFLNILSCTILQVKRLLKTNKMINRGPPYKEFPLTGAQDYSSLATIFLTRKRFRVSRAKDEEENETVLAVKNSWAKWAVIIFHGGLLLILLGILVSSLSKSDGILPIMEGQQVIEDRENYVLLDDGILSGNHSGSPITINKLSTEYDSQAMIKAYSAQIKFADETFLLNSQQPISSQGFTVYQDKYGYTLTLGITGVDRKTTSFTFPLLMVPNKNSLYANTIDIPGTHYVLTATLYPNATISSSDKLKYISIGNALLHPLIDLQIKDSNGREIKSAYLKKSAIIELAGNKIQLQEIGQWCSIRLVKDFGVGIIYAGFAVISLALVILYIFIPKEIICVFRKDGNVVIGGRTGHYRYLFQEEMDDLLAYLLKEGDV